MQSRFTTNRYRQIHRFLVWVVLFFSSAGLIYVALLAAKMRLSGDDYCLDAVLLREGLVGMVVRSYLEIPTYNGNRYSQIFFSGLAGLSPIWGNGFLVIGSLFVWIAGLTYLVRWIANRLHLPVDLLEALALANSYACLVLWSTPRLDQSVIWRSAMTAYFMPLVALTGLLVLIIATAESNGPKWWRLAVIFLTALMAAGFSETGAAMQAGFLGLVMLMSLWVSQRKRAKNSFLLPTIVGLIGVLMGLAIMYFSPVTAMRRATMPAGMPVIELLALLGLNIRVYLWHTIMRRTLVVILPVLFGLGLGLIYFIIQPASRTQANASVSWKGWSMLLILVAAASVFLIACVMLPATYVQADYPPERALILAQSVVTAGCLLGGVLTVLWVDSVFNLSKQRGLWLQHAVRVISLILLLSVLVSPILLISQNAAKLPFYTRWSQLWELRHEELLAAGKMNMDEIHVMELDHVVSDVGELSPDPDYWYNNCAEMYYGIKSIYADQPGW